jgi:Xaa-Pro aminopeptidase
MIQERIEKLRVVMRRKGISACIVPGTDPHASEYIAECWKDRVWISGFTGSAGTVVIALEKAGLWTDSRYFLQGEAQLAGSGIDLMKMGLPETPGMVGWIISTLKKGESVGVNPQMFSVDAYQSLQNELSEAGIELISIDLISEIWTDRPAMPSKECFVFDVKYAGKSVAEKLRLLRAEMQKACAQVVVLSALDDIAWLFNIRGNDVDYNPVVIAFAVVDSENATIFINPEKVNSETVKYFSANGVTTEAYHSVYQYLEKISPEAKVWIDGAKLNRSLYESIPAGCKKLNRMSPVFRLKSIKNDTEVAGYRRAMVKDGVALTRFFMWLEANVHNGKLTEFNIDKKLLEFRSEQENFIGPSFGTIAGYREHGAIVHYSATDDSASTLQPEGIFLLDSGGQYLDGTTDITRTITLGNPTEEEKTDFTLVLKGHIALSSAIFPVGTRGSQLDILARKAMWDLGLNYGHGTGHGVGHFLNVHEGPQSIRMDENPVTLQEGMFMSNEPGLYRTGKYGIRTENLVLVVPAFDTEFGKFLKFETLTLFPIDQDLIDVDLLTDKEIEWINDYHKMVYEHLSPNLNEEERAWLELKCSEIFKLPY